MKNLIPQFSKLETPFYYYDMSLLEETLQAIKAANAYGYHVHYAIKANVNEPILKLIKEAGMGVDCVSGNEVKLALENGFSPEDIVLAGVGKTDKEIEYALEAGIFAFNVESIPELLVIDEIAAKLAKTAHVSMRINPEIEAGTHHYITTGSKENKFGISTDELLESLDTIKGCANVDFIGLHYHIGSQITDIDRFKNLTERVNFLQEELLSRGFSLPHLNVGGGFGIDYECPDKNSIPDFQSYFKVFNDHLKVLPGQQVHFELGRSVVGQCGSLITKVLYVKEGGHTKFVIVDAGMTELMRPALYQAKHKLINISSEQSEDIYDVVGPICESSDWFGRKVSLPKTSRGDLIVIRSTGAYGETMRNNYNGRQFAKAYYSTDLGE
ncbi:diaminopimelate decarboxylase [Marinoscillum sp. MHG1-6]|uniref:diaminopimelate decarboxylase n=1 Tax=Marinoscillum sp. MHG1-6 TaxID=2959627 RepID=UPI002157D7E5|nr:diaminopimelate decarboxylase [Marinoscillum sp. MHG1-6]